MNAQHLKALDDATLAGLVLPFAAKLGLSGLDDGRLPAICGLFKDRCDTLVALADWVKVFYAEEVSPQADELAKHVTDAVRPALKALDARLQVCAWDKASISAAIKETLTEFGLKMPHLAMPVRVLTAGTAHTPSVDAVLELLGREKISLRLRNA